MGEVTTAIAHDATVATVKAAIEVPMPHCPPPPAALFFSMFLLFLLLVLLFQALPSVTAATVTFSGTTACEAAGNLITVTFTNDPGE